MTGEMLKITTDELEQLINANTVIGDPIDAGDRTIIPVASFGFGFGSGEGGGSGKASGGEGSGQAVGAGGGGGVQPVAVIIIHREIEGPEGVQVLSLRKMGPLSELVMTVGESVMPQIVASIKKAVKERKEAEGEKIEISEEE
jgi:uncharacterized spore protein YtfJ